MVKLEPEFKPLNVIFSVSNTTVYYTESSDSPYGGEVTEATHHDSISSRDGKSFKGCLWKISSRKV